MATKNKKTVKTVRAEKPVTEVSVALKPPRKKVRRPKVNVFEADDFARDQVGGFVNFLREHAVVGLAVGFIVGQQAQLVVKQLVDSFITPTLSFWLGQDLQKKQFVLHGQSDIPFTWGKFIYAIINFLTVILFIYVIIKLFNLDKLDKPKA